MVTLYFLGGEDVAKRDSREINSMAFHDAGGAPSVLIIPWARSSFEKNYEDRRRILMYFKALGACKVDFADYSDTLKEIAEKVGSSDLLYLTGGITSVLLERIRKKSVDCLLREYDKVIVGRSAGALALCDKCVITMWNRKRRDTVPISGIRLVDFAVKVHYRSSKDSQLRLLSTGGRIFAIPEGSALVSDDGTLKSIGDVYLFQNGEKTKFD